LKTLYTFQYREAIQKNLSLFDIPQAGKHFFGSITSAAQKPTVSDQNSTGDSQHCVIFNDARSDPERDLPSPESRNTIRRVLREPEREADAAAPHNAQTLAGGNAVRTEQLLAEESNLQLSYSTLTR
jgi:hypothetical protein